MLVLCAGFVSIVSAIAREAGLEAGETPGPLARRRGRIAGLIAACVVVGAMFFGNWWWTAEASNYARYVYKPLQATPTVTPDGRLRLDLRDPGWIASRRLDDFVTDHGHLMHLFIVSPALDRLWHLHPDEITTGAFEAAAARHAARSSTSCSPISCTGPASRRRSPVSSIRRRFAASR